MNKVLTPSKTYLDIVKKESVTLKEALKDQLLILDLNGTLVSRSRKNRSMYVRPYSQAFFNYIFDNFTVMVWSSATARNVDSMCDIFGSKRKGMVIWDRNSFNLSKSDFNSKVVTIKNLETVWKYFSDKYDATNTILLDDSSKKTVLQPFNAIHPTEFKHSSQAFLSRGGESELLNVITYLKTLQFQSNIANYIKKYPYQSDPIGDLCSEPTVVDLSSRENKQDNSVNTLISNMSKVNL